MTSPRRLLRIAAVSAGLFVVFLLAMGSAGAAPVSRYVQDVPTTSGSWGAVAAANGSSPSAGSSYVINWNLTGAVVYQYFQVVNTGTLGLTGETYTATNTKPTNGNAPPTIAIDACVGATWNTVTGTCAATVVRITATSQAATAATISIAAGNALSVRAEPITLPNFPQPYTTTISVSVTNAQARPPATTNS